MIGWKEYINGQSIEEERKERGKDYGLYTMCQSSMHGEYSFTS